MVLSNFRVLSYFSYNQLIRNNVHLGDAIKSKSWFDENFFYLSGSFNGHFILALNLTVQATRNSLFLVEKFVSRRLKIILSSHSLLISRRVYLECFFLSKFGCYYTNKKWVGGLLTNFKILSLKIFPFLSKIKRINRKYFRKRIFKKWLRLLNLMGGFINARFLPSFVFGTSLQLNPWIFHEAFNLLIPAAGLVDSDSSHISVVTYPIPANDDSFKTLLFFFLLFKNGFFVGRLVRKKRFLFFLNLALILLRKKQFNNDLFSVLIFIRFMRKINPFLFKKFVVSQK